MYPGFIPRWRSRRCESRAGAGAGYGYGEGWHRGFAYSAAGEGEAGQFGLCGGGRGGAGAGCGCGEGWHRGFAYSAAGEEESGQFGFGGGAFGVRRPLRFLAYKLGLEETQVSELAKILDEIKTERAQAAVDHRR